MLQTVVEGKKKYLLNRKYYHLMLHVLPECLCTAIGTVSVMNIYKLIWKATNSDKLKMTGRSRVNY